MKRYKPVYVIAVLALLATLAVMTLPAVAVATFVEYPATTGASGPEGITGGPDGNVWFTEFAGNNVGMITPAGAVTEYPLPNAGSGPEFICSGPDGALWFTEQTGNRIGRITTAGVITEFNVPTAASSPRGICPGPDGNLWFIEAAADKVGKVTTAGAFTEYNITTVSSDPYAIAPGPDGNLWFTETNVNQIGRITTSGVITEYPLATVVDPPDPTGIAMGPDGWMWFCCFGSSEIGRISPTDGTVTRTPVLLAGNPWNITKGPDFAMWFTDGANSVQRITTSGAVTLHQFTNGSEVNQIATGPDGRVWVTERGRNNIARGTLNPPSVYGMTPSTAVKGATVNVTYLAGANFFDTIADVRLSRTGSPDIVATGVTAVSGGQITCTFDIPADAATGLWDLSVQNSDGQTGTLANAFNVTVEPPPVLPDWYLAEGTSAWGFTTYITIENPNNTQCTAGVTYNTPSGPVSGPFVVLPPMSQTTINPETVVPSNDFSTVVTCLEGKTLAVDRTMTWTGAGAPASEAHSSVSVDGPSRTWYLAEGSSKWGFETWLCLQNPNQVDAFCTVTYMIEGEGPVTVQHTVPANTRRSFDISQDIGAKDASIKVNSYQPVIAERAMYRNARREGHDSIGTTAAASDFYMAEGTTAWGFTTYVVVQNPNDSDTAVNITYMTPSGSRAQPAFNMSANSRKTIRVNDIKPENGYPIDVSNIDFSTRVHGSQPIIAERAMYWGEGTALGEACHESIGLDSPHMTFFLPDGEARTGGNKAETWTCVQNPHAVAVTVRVSYLTPSGTGNVVFTDEVPARSRKTYNMIDRRTGRAAIMVESLDAARPVMVERAMYWNGRGAGAATIGSFLDLI